MGPTDNLDPEEQAQLCEEANEAEAQFCELEKNEAAGEEETPAPDINLDNVMIYELEADRNFDYATADEETKQQVDDYNHDYEQGTLHDQLMGRFSLCPCRRPDFDVRMQGYVSRGEEPNPSPIQEDFDAMQFAAIIESNCGKYSTTHMIITRCIQCGRMEFFGTMEPVAGFMAKAYNAFFAEQAASKTSAKLVHDDKPDLMDRIPEELKGVQFIAEDLDTGELTPADDIGQALFGGNSGANVTLTDAE